MATAAKTAPWWAFCANFACENTLGVAMPCQSSRNFGEDMVDALAVAEQFHIETVTVDLTEVKQAICRQIEGWKH